MDSLRSSKVAFIRSIHRYADVLRLIGNLVTFVHSNVGITYRRTDVCHDGNHRTFENRKSV